MTFFQSSNMGISATDTQNLFFSQQLASHSPTAMLSALEQFLLQVSLHQESDQCDGEYQKWLHLQFQYMPQYLKTLMTLPSEYEYSAYLNILADCCRMLELTRMRCILGTPSGQMLRKYEFVETRLTLQTFKELVWVIRGRYQTQIFRSAQAARRREINVRYQEYRQYVNTLFEQNDRLIVIRVDLGYSAEQAGKIDFEMASDDIDRLLANRRWNKLFDHQKGYIIKTEFGIEKGIHFHALFFFNGSERNGSSHVHLAQKIGDYWKEIITHGRGIYWNSNAQINDFVRLGNCGIGLIHWRDEKLRQNLLDHVLGYFFKDDQFFKPKGTGKYKLFRKGQYSSRGTKKLGRPRHGNDTVDRMF
ncbi:inovirus-type Gp2 protein [Undibacterium sp. CY7W]|uniref:Inovirus-type Gp2 protein n=2 Tax=Undibacterium rugosum TaxID=2762291 RepID=A0A923I3E4_9BURK|nr:inovirus-type Gp2 protein [Undibacterium rugosum]MBC3935620.1 inovirus-type Gp2 protein [Undibacterium rugosum]